MNELFMLARSHFQSSFCRKESKKGRKLCKHCTVKKYKSKTILNIFIGDFRKYQEENVDSYELIVMNDYQNKVKTKTKRKLYNDFDKKHIRCIDLENVRIKSKKSIKSQVNEVRNYGLQIYFNSQIYQNYLTLLNFEYLHINIDHKLFQRNVTVYSSKLNEQQHRIPNEIKIEEKNINSDNMGKQSRADKNVTVVSHININPQFVINNSKYLKYSQSKNYKLIEMIRNNLINGQIVEKKNMVVLQ